MDPAKEQLALTHLPLVEKIARELSRAHRIPRDLFDDLVGEGYEALTRAAIDNPVEDFFPVAARAVRNAMAKYAMQSLRRSRREYTTSTVNTPESDSDTTLNLEGMSIQERLAATAWVRGVPTADIRKTLNFSFDRIIQLGLRALGRADVDDDGISGNTGTGLQ